MTAAAAATAAAIDMTTSSSSSSSSSVTGPAAVVSRGKSGSISSSASRSRSRFTTITTAVLLGCLMVGAVTFTVTYNISDTVISKTKQQQRKTADAAKDVDVAFPAATTTTTTTTTSTPETKMRKKKLSGWERLLESEPEPDNGDDEDAVNALKEDALVAKIAEKLKPVSLRFIGQSDVDGDGDGDGDGEVEVETITTNKKDEKNQKKHTMIPHQFLHLHHMKTGGTSIDHLMRCSMDRLRTEAHYQVPYYSIHECSRSRFATCLTNPENVCRASMDNAAVMSYCGALKYLDEFGWWHNNNEKGDIKAFTVLRHPVDRVWSMFRFQTKNCFKCTPLKEIYEKLDSGETTGLDTLCLNQLQNHEVANLLSTEWPLEVTELKMDDDNDNEVRDKMVQEAIDNMKGFFTVIGITEELVETSKILGTIFPWMHLEGNDQDGTTSTCTLPHANSSPKNNRCGEGNTHWDLPKQPDQETIDLILKYNSLDMELYESAVAYFEMQKRALGLAAVDVDLDAAVAVAVDESEHSDSDNDADADAEDNGK